MTPGQCPYLIDCNFEAGDTCLWESVYEQTTMEWIVSAAISGFIGRICLYWTLTNISRMFIFRTFLLTLKGSGPSIDHTFETAQGKYLYMQTNGTLQTDSIARLESPVLFLAQEYVCM